jgi:hypothetical protein
MNATATAERAATWGTWKDLGNVSAIVYFGRNKRNGPDPVGKHVVIVKASIGWAMLNSAGARVDTGGYASRFWGAVDTDAPANQVPDAPVVPAPRQPQTAGDPTVATTQPPAKSARPGRNAKLRPCLCGCTAQVRGMYKQGHDARHASAVAQAIIAAGIGSDREAMLKAMKALPTEALQMKALNIVRKVMK